MQLLSWLLNHCFKFLKLLPWTNPGMLQSFSLLLLFESFLRKHHCLCTVPLKCDHSPKKSHLERACPPCKILLLCYPHCQVDFSSPAAGVFFLVACFKQVRVKSHFVMCPEKSLGVCLVMGKRLEQKSRGVLNSERKKLFVSL